MIKEREVYFADGYDSKARFCSYWHQVHEIVSLKPRNVLEIGVGNGFLSDYLRRRGYEITTVDIDESLNPDYVGSVLSLPFTDESFDVVACFEVLEHIPYECFNRAMREIHRVCCGKAVLSVPDLSRAYPLWLRLPRIGDIKWVIKVPRLRPHPHKFDGSHRWEIGKAGYTLRRIAGDLSREAFEIIKTYRVFEVPGHRFFVLRKRVA